VHAGTRSSKIDGHDRAHHRHGVAVRGLAGAIILTPAVRAADGLAALLVAFLMVRSARERAGRPATVTSIGPSIPARSRHNAAAHESGPCRS
jgi:hypothetical protein